MDRGLLVMSIVGVALLVTTVAPTQAPILVPTPTATVTSIASAPIVVTTNDVTIDGVTITSSGSSGVGIYVAGSASAPIRNLTIRNCTIKGFDTAIEARHVENLVVENCVITDANYAGIAVYSGVGGRIAGNTIQRIGYGRTDFEDSTEGNNAYGITLDRAHTGNLTTDPQTTGFVVDGNTVEDVPLWMCLNAHAATDTSFSNNTVLRCPRAIFVAGDGDTPNNLPRNITISGNRLEQAVTTSGGTTDKTGITISSLQGGSITNNAVSATYDNNPPVFDFLGLSTGVTISGTTILP